MRLIYKPFIALLFLFILFNLVIIEKPIQTQIYTDYTRIHADFIDLDNPRSSACNLRESALNNIFSTLTNLCFAEVLDSSFGKVNSDDINIRSDSTVSSEVICKVKKGDNVEIISELYDWYKIKLPKNAPSFVKKDLVTLSDEKTAKVIKDNVNIRLKADESSAIIGRAAKDELVNVENDSAEWLKIEPVENSFGWIHKNFVNKVALIKELPETELAKKAKEESELINEISPVKKEETIIVEGIIKPKVMKKIATHKLVNLNGSLYLLKGGKENIAAFNNHKARVQGKIINDDKQGIPIIEIIKIELLD